MATGQLCEVIRLDTCRGEERERRVRNCVEYDLISGARASPHTLPSSVAAAELDSIGNQSRTHFCITQRSVA